MSIYGIIKNKSMDEVEKEFDGKNYGFFKEQVANAIIEELKPFQDKYDELMQNKDYLEKIYTEGSRKAEEKARIILDKVYKKVGLI